MRMRMIGGVVVLLLVATGITINWHHKNCPTRAYFPDDAFPAKARLIDTKYANAVAQWTRKYDLPCQTCHTAFPRLNYYGELFQRNGYQLPGVEPDGDSTKKEVNDHLFIDKVENLLGVRISFTPVEVTTKALNVNGGRKLRYNFGAANWLQLFVAGSIFKNASIFIEAEIPGLNPTAYSASGVMHTNWFTLGYHNIFKTSWLNVRTGKLSMLNWAAQSGRLRMIPNINTQATRMQTSSGVASEDQIRYNDPIPAIELYGYNKYFLYSVGVANGAQFTDLNQYKNFFSTLRLEYPNGNFAGSAITSTGLLGYDTLTSTTNQRVNRFYTFTGGMNLRWKNTWDLIGEFVWLKENNPTFNNVHSANRRYGITGQLGYLATPEWFFALQYDYVTGQAWTADQYNKISENFTYMPRENFRINLTLRQEIKHPPTGRQNEFLLNIRSMF
jgi:hypothetical protein